MSSRTIKITVGAVVVAVAVGVLIWAAVGRGSVTYYTVSELIAKGPTQQISVSGELTGGTVQGLGTTNLKFVMHDRENPDRTISVTYNGVIPDSFKDQADAEVVAQGDFSAGQTLTATAIEAKCPSKYEAAK